MHGIKLLPLDTGEFGYFGSVIIHVAVFIDSDEHPRSLLPGVNFVHILRAAFTHVCPKSPKKTLIIWLSFLRIWYLRTYSCTYIVDEIAGRRGWFVDEAIRNTRLWLYLKLAAEQKRKRLFALWSKPGVARLFFWRAKFHLNIVLWVAKKIFCLIFSYIKM